jgi:hypothetical protein
MEGAYRSSLLKSFKKNIDGGYFPFLIGILQIFLKRPSRETRENASITELTAVLRIREVYPGFGFFSISDPESQH